MALHIRDRVLMSEWKNTLFLVGFSLREQLVVLNTFQLPCGHTTHTSVQIQTDEKVNKYPEDPILHCSNWLPMSDKNNSILSSVQHHILNRGSSTQ